jgi:3-hydroxyacyl-CoA dehydrogenase
VTDSPEPVRPPVRIERRGRALLLTIDNPPVNVLGRAVREGLAAALDRAEAAVAAGTAERVVVTGAGRAFVAGADAREFDAAPAEPHLPDLLLRLARLPAVAAINGAALGGGFEIALACRARVAGPRAVVGLPEVTLGVVPGAGGTQRLPRLVGIAAALGLIGEGRTLKAGEALAQGLVDAVEDDPVAAALVLDPALLARPALDERPGPAPDPEAVAAARAQAARRMTGQVAPLRAIELVEAAATLPFAEGLARERAAFLELREGGQARALRHVFFAERAAGPGPEVAALEPAPLSTALVAGGGTMGAAIAYALDAAGLRVTILERDAAAAERARANVASLFAEGVKRGKVAPDEAARRQAGFGFVHGDAPLPPVDLAIEAVFEDPRVKRAIFGRLGQELPEEAILATNTSYLDPDAIAEGLLAPERFLGLHFFAPAHVMRLVEVIRARATSPQTLATAFGLTRRLGKIAVEAGVCDGFIGNRILTRYRQAGDAMLLEGALPVQVDAALEGFGMAMGPYAVQDLSGLDIAHANRKRKGPAAAPAPVADRMVEELGRLGRKTGAGWYDYADGTRTPSEAVARLVAEESEKAGVARRPFGADEIVRRLMLAMIAEGLAILDEGIARRPADIDLVMIHGYGFPRWRGGPMHMADAWGLGAVREGIAGLAAADPPAWRVPPLLDRLLAEGRRLDDLNRSAP